MKDKGGAFLVAVIFAIAIVVWIGSEIEDSHRSNLEQVKQEVYEQAYNKGYAAGQEDIWDYPTDHGVYTEDDIQEAYSQGYYDALEEYGIKTSW